MLKLLAAIINEACYRLFSFLVDADKRIKR